MRRLPMLALGLVLACGGEPDAPTPPTPPPAPSPAPESNPTLPASVAAPSPASAPLGTVAPAAADAPAGEADGVYLVVQGVGLVRLAPSGAFELAHADLWRAHPTTHGWIGLPGPAGPIVRSDGAPLPAPPALTYLSDVAVAPDGSIWLAAAQGVARWDGSAWTATERRERPSLQNLVVEGTGTPWFLGDDGSLHSFRAGGVERVVTPGTIRALAVDARGRVVVAHDGGVVRRDGEVWTTLSTGPLGAPAFRADDTMVLRRGTELAVMRAGAGAPTPISLSAMGAPVAVIADAGFDGAGRLWLSTHVGVIVLEASLDRLARWYPSGTVPSLSSTDGIWGIFGVGRAGELPAAAPATGHVRGRIVRGGAPMVGVAIELCSRANARFDPIDGSPCNIAERPDLPTTITGPDGVFELVNIDGADLDVAVEVEPEDWFVASDSACCMGAGPSRLDLGDIEVR